jgi:hypothetical protein
MNDAGNPMAPSKAPLLPSLRDLLDEDRRALAVHPQSEEWAAYREGRVGAEEAERLQDHLAVCRECADHFLGQSAFAKSEPPEGTRPLSEGQVEAAWWRFRGRLRKEGPDGAYLPWPWRSLAAALLVAVAGSSFLSVSLYRDLAQARRPQVNPRAPVTVRLRAEVAPEESSEGTRRSGGSDDRAAPWEVKATETNDLKLALPPGTRTYPRYRLEIVRATGGRPLFREIDFAPNDDHAVILRINPEFLDPGRYDVRIFGMDQEPPGDKLIVSYPFQVTR